MIEMSKVTNSAGESVAIVERNVPVKITTTSVTAATPVEWVGGDHKAVLVINNTGSSAATVTVLAGNGLQGMSDLVISVPAGINLLKLESGRFLNVSGDYKGKIVIKSSAAVAVGVAALV